MNIELLIEVKREIRALQDEITAAHKRLNIFFKSLK